MSQKTDAPLESYEVNGATIAVFARRNRRQNLFQNY